MSEDKDILMMLAIFGSRTDRHCLMSDIATGLRSHHLSDEERIAFATSP